jgi:RNA polymerase sigma-70 factor, ECF subfamily
MAQTSVSLLERLSDRSDSEAWTRLVELYSPLIRRWLGQYELAESDADDLCRTVLAALVANLPKFRHNGRVGAFRAWLRTITVNSARQTFRKYRRMAASPGGSAFLASLDQLDDRTSGLSHANQTSINNKPHNHAWHDPAKYGVSQILSNTMRRSV